MTGVIDYGIGNLGSVSNALSFLEIPHIVTSDLSSLSRVDTLILPGVGAAAAGMHGLKERDMITFIDKKISEGTPLLGLCLGMQLLFSDSEEGQVSCLDIIPGCVKAFKRDKKVPHVGWNHVHINDTTDSLCRSIPQDSLFYFVHSYYCVPEDTSCILGTTTYGETYCSMVKKGEVYGAQYHPEKSSSVGLQLLKNFCSLRART